METQWKVTFYFGELHKGKEQSQLFVQWEGELYSLDSNNLTILEL